MRTESSPFQYSCSFRLFLLFQLVAFAVVSASKQIIAPRTSIDGDRKNTRITSQRQSYTPVFLHSKWKGTDRWIGPEWWSNPLLDWSVSNGRVIANARKLRTLCYLPAEIAGSGTWFNLAVKVNLIKRNARFSLPAQTSVGFRIGRQGQVNDFRHSLIFATRWLDVVVDSRGRLVLGNRVSKGRMRLYSGPVTLTLTCKKIGGLVTLTFQASRGSQTVKISNTFPVKTITGGVSLLSNGPEKETHTRVAFRDFRLSGNLVRYFPGRAFGPILWTQYSLSKRTLRLQAQLAAFSFAATASLYVRQSSSQWRLFSTRSMHRLSRTVLFTVPNWNSKINQPYRVEMTWQGKRYSWRGTIRREPNNNKLLKLACFSCDNGYLFPLPTMVAQVGRQNPDMLFFAGDQIYEDSGDFEIRTFSSTPTAMLDFLYRYYQFGWTWRELLRDRPSVIIPDDHDIFQGNLFGHRGRQLPRRQPFRWGLGGYLLPSDWVNAVERIHVGHLPPSAVNLTLGIGIKPYFTSLTYGGVGFAVLEDRKFKTAPLSLSLKESTEGIVGDLLGPEQENFLKAWAREWKGQIMKCALSQTIFAAAATHSGYKLNRNSYYRDSGAWPKAARNRVVRILGDNNVLSIHGDQHLGILLRQGVNKFNDAGYAFMVPGTANGWPRAWWPGLQNGQLPTNRRRFTGLYYDDAGHPLNVVAVGNPNPKSLQMSVRTNRRMQVGYAKGSGYGVVEFMKKTGMTRFSLYRLGNTKEMFPGFPKTVFIGGNPTKKKFKRHH